MNLPKVTQQSGGAETDSDLLDTEDCALNSSGSRSLRRPLWKTAFFILQYFSFVLHTLLHHDILFHVCLMFYYVTVLYHGWLTYLEAVFVHGRE